MQKIFFFLFLLLSIFANAQQQDSLSRYTIDQLLEKVDKSISTDKSKLYFYGNELLQRNAPDSIKFEGNMTLGFYERDVTGNIHKSISYFEKAMKICPNLDRQRVLFRLSEAYALINEYDKALKCIDDLEKIGKKPFTISYSMIYFLMGDFKKSTAIDLKTIKQFDLNLSTHPELKNTILRSKYKTYGNQASYYNYQNKLDSATYYINKLKSENIDFYNSYFDGLWFPETFNLILRAEYDKAIVRMEKSKVFINSSSVDRYNAYYYYAICYKKKRDYKKSLKYAEIGINSSVSMISFQNFELELYKIAYENAQKLGLKNRESYYLKKYNEGAQKINYQQKAAFMAKLYEQDIIKPLNKELIAKEKRAYYLWSGLAMILILFGSYFGYSIYKSKRDKKYFIAIIEKLKKENYQNSNLSETTELESSEEIEEIEGKQSSKNSITISEETERKIVKKLENFERKMQFLSPDISLGKIAQDFKTNAYYITYVIKFHKKTNFNGYINKLRIDYITHKLKFNSEYTNYKIEYLAQESGFSSYSTFKRIFTKETGIDPSKFISYLKEYK